MCGCFAFHESYSYLPSLCRFITSELSKSWKSVVFYVCHFLLFYYVNSIKEKALLINQLLACSEKKLHLEKNTFNVLQSTAIIIFTVGHFQLTQVW